mgnify:CR=1 FL=1
MKQNSPTISIIIPVLNEELQIEALISYIRKNSNPQYIKEILVVDGGSIDNTVSISQASGATVLNSAQGRASQQNFGAKHAIGEILYFLHADTFPPSNFDIAIINAVSKNELSGCFRMQFDSNSKFLKFFAWFTRLNFKICRGGDQSLFITKKLFNSLNGFNEDYIIYEDSEFISRLYSLNNFTVLPKQVTTSARKYEEKGMLRLQYHFSVIHIKNRLGKSPAELYQYYQKNIIN